MLSVICQQFPLSFTEQYLLFLLKSYFNGLQLNIGSYVKMNILFVLKIETLLNIGHKLEYE